MTLSGERETNPKFCRPETMRVFHGQKTHKLPPGRGSAMPSWHPMNETTPDGNERKWIWQRPAIGFVLLIGFGRPEPKAKTLHKYLGPGYEVLASFGHVRDLPAKDGSVDPEHNFKMIWEVDTKSQKRLNDIAHALKGANKLILATDPDREGEAISWHVL